MIHRFFAISALILLASCAYSTEGHIQDVEVTTPGAKNSICYVSVEGLRYKVRPPQKVNIFKSREDLVVDCVAPGNRERQVVIQPEVSSAAMVGNTANFMVPGLAWDYFSGAMYKYPDVVAVDFTGLMPRPEDLPAQNSPDIKQPEEYTLEEVLPSRPRMNADRNKVVAEPQRRKRGAPTGYLEDYISGGEYGPGGAMMPDEKGYLAPLDIPPGLNPDQDEGLAVPPDVTGPVPLYPGN